MDGGDGEKQPTWEFLKMFLILFFSYLNDIFLSCLNFL